MTKLDALIELSRQIFGCLILLFVILPLVVIMSPGLIILWLLNGLMEYLFCTVINLGPGKYTPDILTCIKIILGVKV